DHEHFARLDETELAAGDFFDSGGVFAQTSRRFTQVRVLVQQDVDRSDEPLVLALGAECLEEALLADQRVDGDDGRNRQQYHLDDAGASCRRLRPGHRLGPPPLRAGHAGSALAGRCAAIGGAWSVCHRISDARPLYQNSGWSTRIKIWLTRLLPIASSCS